MKKYNCLFIDDDEVALLKAKMIAKRFDVLNIVGFYTSANAALSILEKEKIDILFLDIDMPTVNGLDFRKQMMHVPLCVFISSHSEFAAESFELQTLDFIVKPLRQERFAQTVDRIIEFMEMRHKVSLFETSFGNDFFYIKEGYNKIKVKLYDIIYLEALKDFTMVVTAQKRYCVSAGIGDLLREKEFVNFVRIHRSYAAQRHFIEKIEPEKVQLINSTLLPIGNSFRKNLD